MDISMHIKTESFDGPLGLLLFLLQKEDINIRELDLTKVTQQYLSYLAQMRELNFDVAGDYLYLAVTLLLIKSKAVAKDVLGESGEESSEDAQGPDILSRSDLVRRLEELQHFQRLGRLLWTLPKHNHQIFTRPKINRRSAIDSILTPLDLNKLTMAMMEFLYKQKRRYTVVERDKLSVREKLAFLKGYLKQGEEMSFEGLLNLHGEENPGNIIVTFISLLELARLRSITIFQTENCGNIYIRVLKSLDNFDLNSAYDFTEESLPDIPDSFSKKVATQQ